MSVPIFIVLTVLIFFLRQRIVSIILIQSEIIVESPLYGYLILRVSIFPG